MISEIEKIPEVKIIGRLWDEVRVQYEKIQYNLDKINMSIEASIGNSVDMHGNIDLAILAENLKCFDISKETIEKYRGSLDDEEFFDVLSIIIRAKINRALKECPWRLKINII